MSKQLPFTDWRGAVRPNYHSSDSVLQPCSFVPPLFPQLIMDLVELFSAILIVRVECHVEHNC